MSTINRALNCLLFHSEESNHADNRPCGMRKHSAGHGFVVIRVAVEETRGVRKVQLEMMPVLRAVFNDTGFDALDLKYGKCLRIQSSAGPRPAAISICTGQWKRLVSLKNQSWRARVIARRSAFLLTRENYKATRAAFSWRRGVALENCMLEAKQSWTVLDSNPPDRIRHAPQMHARLLLGAEKSVKPAVGPASLARGASVGVAHDVPHESHAHRQWAASKASRLGHLAARRGQRAHSQSDAMERPYTVSDTGGVAQQRVSPVDALILLLQDAVQK